MKQEKSMNNIWKSIAERWSMHQHPGIPSEETVSIFRKLIEDEMSKHNIKNPKVLLHGSTPELRDMLFELGAEVVIIDKFMQMILGMSELMTHKNDKEIIIKADWINPPLEDNYFDFVIGDLTIGNVLKKNLRNYLESIKRVLKRDGYWITRIACHTEEFQDNDFQKIFDEFCKIPVKHQNMSELLSLFTIFFYNSETDMVSISDLGNWMKQYEISPGIYNHPDSNAKKVLQKMWDTWKPMDKQWQFYSIKKTREFISGFFDIEDQISPNTAYYHILDELFPIFKCKVKK